MTRISELSTETQAVLLLTAPLLPPRGAMGRDRVRDEPLTAREYRRLAEYLAVQGHSAGDLLAPDAEGLITHCDPIATPERLRRLLDRGFALGVALDRWGARTIRVFGVSDAGYPQRLRERMGVAAPLVLYVCGDPEILDVGGLAVVGSRNADDEALDAARDAGYLTAGTDRPIVSGGARGIDRAAMSATIEAGGRAVGILAERLESAAVQRDHRDAILDGRLVLASPFDPAAPFGVGPAMARNKLIYALADAALIVRSDYERGGTWAGAVEQLRTYRFAPVYVRQGTDAARATDALIGMGARAWPAPRDTDELLRLLDESLIEKREAASPVAAAPDPDNLRARILNMATRPITETQVAQTLRMDRLHARSLLHDLVGRGVLKRLARPVRYLRPDSPQESLFST